MKKPTELSQPEKLVRVNGNDIAKKPLSEQARKRLQAAAEMPDSQIDFSDAPEVPVAPDMSVYRPVKMPVSLRLDADILQWLRKRPGYQGLINDILRAEYNAFLAGKR